MKYRTLWLLSLTCSLFSTHAFAIAIDIPPGHWQCMAVDAKKENFGAHGKSVRAAKRAAKKECRKRSSVPKTCKTAQSFCEEGPKDLTGNRCIVSDESGRTWNTTGKNACRTAMYMCRQWQYLHGSTRSVCTVKHRMKNYDRGKSDKEKDKDGILEKLFDID